MIVEKLGFLVISVVLTVMLSIKYVKRYHPINLVIIAIVSFVDSVFIYFIINNVYTALYLNITIYIINIIIPLILVLLEYNNIILKKEIIYYMMRYLFKIKEYDKTIEYITKLVKIEGRTNEYMYILGKCYKEKGDYINARDSFAYAIELDPKDFKSCYEFGTILDKTNKKQVACAMYNKALKLNPNFYEAAEALGISLTSQGKFRKATNVYKEVVKKFHKAYEIYYNIGMLEMELGNYIDAIDAFSSCTMINPTLYMAHYNIAKLQYILKNYDKAICSYKKIVTSQIYGAKAYFKMATIYAIKGEYTKAIANLEYAIELDDVYLNEAYKEDSFNKMKDIVIEFCNAKEKQIATKKQNKNFMSDKFALFRKKESFNIKISV